MERWLVSQTYHFRTSFVHHRLQEPGGRVRDVLDLINSPDSSCVLTVLESVLEPVWGKTSRACPLPNVSLSEYESHRPRFYPAGPFWNQRLLKSTSALSTASSTLSDSPNVPCRITTFRTVWSVPPPSVLTLPDQGKDHPGLVSNPCLHLP